MTGSGELTRDVDIDIAGLMREVWKRIWLVVAIPLIAAVALFVVLSSMDPSYRSSARVIIEKRESVFTRRADGDLAMSGNQFDEQAVGSQVEVLNSDDLALKVIARLKLTDHEEFRSEKQSGFSRFVAELAGGSEIELSPEERMLAEFRKRLTVFAIEKTRVIAIEFWAHDRTLAQEVPNAIADEYLAFTKQTQLQTTEEATGWLGTEIEELRAKVRASEAKVADYRANSDILLGNNNALLATQQLSETSSELSRVRGERTSAEGKVAAIRQVLEQGASIDVLPEVISSSLIQRLREREAALQAQISELETTLLANHPRLKALKSQAVDYQEQIRTAARNILKSLENNVSLLREQESRLLGEVNRLKAESGRVGEAEVELRALEREAAAQRELLETYLTRFREAASRQDRDYLPVDARIISRAVMPAKSFFPKVVPFTLAGAAMMLVLVIVGILAWALLAGKAFKPMGAAGGQVAPELVPERVAVATPPAPKPATEDETYAPPVTRERLHHRDLLPPEPAAPANVRLPEVNAPPLFAAEQYPTPANVANADGSFTATETVTALLEMGRARIAVVSPGGDDGSAVSWALVRRLAQHGSAIVIDLTGSSCTSMEFLGTAKAPGLRDLLRGSAGFRDVVHRDRRSAAAILPGGDGPEPGAGALDRLGRMADALAEAYDYVVFDCGVSGPAGLSRIASHDTLVIVSAEGVHSSEAFAVEAEMQQAGFAEAVVVRLAAHERGFVHSHAAA